MASDAVAHKSGWEPIAAELGVLVEALSAWAGVVLVPLDETRLGCVASYRLPADWAVIPNRLDSGSMNARAFLAQREIVENNIDQDRPPTKQTVSRHRMTAAAVIPLPGVGTLEVLADTDGYCFDEGHLEVMRATGRRISRLASTPASSVLPAPHARFEGDRK